jgi:hypothetical protein
MSVAEERLARLEAELAQLKPTLHQRMEKLEAAAPKPWWKSTLAAAGSALPQLATGVVVLVIAFGLKDSVDLAIKQQQLQFSYAKEMTEQLKVMAKAEAGPSEMEHAAVLLAGFGPPAAMPLLNELRYGGNRATAAEAGLRALAFMHPAAVCAVAVPMVSNPARSVGWWAHAATGRATAAANCQDALPALRGYERLLAPVEEGKTVDFSNLVSDEPNPAQQKLWLNSIRQSIKQLSSNAKRRT